MKHGIVITLFCWIILSSVVVHIQRERIERIEECLIDIDNRLTAIEQCQHDNDTLHVRMLQQLNEVSYELKTMEHEKKGM